MRFLSKMMEGSFVPDTPLVRRHLQTIHLTVHYLIGFASIFPFKAERFEWIDALG